MDTQNYAALAEKNSAEIVGLLKAISIISDRLASNIDLLARVRKKEPDKNVCKT